MLKMPAVCRDEKASRVDVEREHTGPYRREVKAGGERRKERPTSGTVKGWRREEGEGK
jgi:hypothetical protein